MAITVSGTTITFNDGTTQTTAATTPVGAGQTWQNVSASRVNGTTYQNTTGRAIMVSLGNSLTTNVQASVDASTWINVGREVGGSTYPNQFIVPNNWYYRNENAGGARFWWAELR